MTGMKTAECQIVSFRYRIKWPDRAHAWHRCLAAVVATNQEDILTSLFFVDLSCDGVACADASLCGPAKRRPTARFIGGNWADCQNAAMHKGWLLVVPFDFCLCPSCLISSGLSRQLVLVSGVNNEAMERAQRAAMASVLNRRYRPVTGRWPA